MARWALWAPKAVKRKRPCRQVGGPHPPGLSLVARGGRGLVTKSSQAPAPWLKALLMCMEVFPFLEDLDVNSFLSRIPQFLYTYTFYKNICNCIL